MDDIKIIKKKRWNQAVISKLTAEGLSIDSDWNLIAPCLSKVVAPTRCMAVARALRAATTRPEKTTMPYQWIAPDLFLEHQGVAVFHCYDDGGELSFYWYTTDPTDDNLDSPRTGNDQFDVRDLPGHGLDANHWPSHAEIIRHAIDEGWVTGEPATTEPALIVRIEVLGGVAHMVDKPPGVEVEIVDHDVDEEE